MSFWQLSNRQILHYNDERNLKEINQIDKPFMANHYISEYIDPRFALVRSGAAIPFYIMFYIYLVYMLFRKPIKWYLTQKLGWFQLKFGTEELPYFYNALNDDDLIWTNRE